MSHPILQHFAYAHLPEHLAAVSRSFGTLAHGMVSDLMPGIQLDVALQRLLEAKDACVRAAIETKRHRDGVEALLAKVEDQT